MNKKLGQGPAFPFEHVKERRSGPAAITKWEPYSGMSKRYFTACMMAKSIIENGCYQHRLDVEGSSVFGHIVVGLAYELADELLKQENL